MRACRKRTNICRKTFTYDTYIFNVRDDFGRARQQLNLGHVCARGRTHTIRQTSGRKKCYTTSTWCIILLLSMICELRLGSRGVCNTSPAHTNRGRKVSRITFDFVTGYWRIGIEERDGGNITTLAIYDDYRAVEEDTVYARPHWIAFRSHARYVHDIVLHETPFFSSFSLYYYY